MLACIRNFLLILAAALASAVLGCLFGALIALLSPEFVVALFRPDAAHHVRFAAAVGAVWGLFIGTAAMCFSIAVAAIAEWLLPRVRASQE